MAAYRLAQERIWGTRADDDQFIPSDYLVRFAKGSVPSTDSAGNPAPASIRAALAAVHARTLAELPTLDPTELDRPRFKPHPLFAAKLGSLLWCARHEMLHCGQIGLVRRQLGYESLW